MRLVCGKLLVFVLFLLSSCGGEHSGEDLSSENNLLEKSLQKEVYLQLHHDEEIKKLTSFNQLSEFYLKNNYCLFWIIEGKFSPFTDSLIYELENAERLGLNKEDYNTQKIKKEKELLAKGRIDTAFTIEAARLELELTDAYFKFLTHLSEGRINQKKIIAKWNGEEVKEKLFNSFVCLKETQSFSNVIASFESSHKDYKRLLVAYNNLRLSGDSIFTRINKIKDDTSAIYSYEYLFLKQRLHSLIKPGKDAIAILSDTVLNKKEIQKLQDLYNERLNQIIVNLERYRVMLRSNYPDTSIVINIPSYQLVFYLNNKIQLTSKVIVGTSETPTPTLTSRINHFYIFPTWSVPYSIASKEILPNVQQNENYLAESNMEVLDKDGNIVDPGTIDWNSFSENNLEYKFRQREGESNSLGIIKFMFPNKHGVYLHDTNAKYLFEKDERSLSHGCVRVEKAFDLAAQLTPFTKGFTKDDIETSINKRNKKYVPLERSVPVIFNYFTVEVQQNGSFVFYKDIYSIDEKMIEAIL